MPKKQCKRCKKYKEHKSFSKNSRDSSGLGPLCKLCSKKARDRLKASKTLEELERRRLQIRAANDRYALKRRYGITQADLDEMMKNARGRCTICRKQKPLVIDHDHGSKIVRGLLCHNCNKGLGMFADSPELLEQAAGYLRALTSDSR